LRVDRAGLDALNAQLIPFLRPVVELGGVGSTHMCGRFVSSSSAERIADYFGASFDPETTLPANYNTAPTNDVYGVVAGPDGQPQLQVFHWGLVPVWAKDVKISSKMINARAETIAEKSAFKSVFKKHRVIIPMDGFYEWAQGSEGAVLTKAGKPSKQPMFIHRLDGEPLAVAGLWTTWRDKTAGPDAPWLHSCTIVTTAANATMAPVHDRMPVLLPAASWQEWLDPANNDTDSLQRLLVPAPDNLLTMQKVSTEVNNVRNKGAELIEPAAGDDGPAKLM
jgi:putative SOS response-associated peptidase YedK